MMNDVASQRYYFDANALVKYYREEQGSLQIKRLVSNAKPILISPLTLVECVSVLMKFNRNNQLKRRKLIKIIKLVDKNTGTDSTIRFFSGYCNASRDIFVSKTDFGATCSSFCDWLK
jgi:predicted nucleic acid-binding protein